MVCLSTKLISLQCVISILFLQREEEESKVEKKKRNRHRPLLESQEQAYFKMVGEPDNDDDEHVFSDVNTELSEIRKMEID